MTTAKTKSFESIYASKAIKGEYYRCVKNQDNIIQVLDFIKDRVIIQSLLTGNELDLNGSYLLIPISKEEAMTEKKKLDAKSAPVKTGKKKEPHKKTYLLELEFIKKAAVSGVIKVSEAAEKLKVEYRQVYMSLRGLAKQGKVTKSAKGTFKIKA